ncbi:lysylphosphatidylglycerol synthase transmembrane domain-containing protein [Maridesulfovibrio zosterae]|uniref:lysylphosphatidylglycerol synthase transmembrane domain-containing protein n=1 Tax=Maridesulfovibrio zosterae TaxID=82171 RepID=UPI0004231E50|nr:lysylphosphatidylglycerol synthase transmembrane domain-containing protein [Maridesulfovibrio zosterae]
MSYPEPKRSFFSAQLANFLKITLAACLIIWLIRSGSIRFDYLTVSKDHLGSFLGGILLIFLGMNVGAFRYKELLKGTEIRISTYNSLKINFVMYFFIQCVLGAASGDIARFFYTVRETGEKPKVGAAIIIDRIIGLMGLFVLAGIGILFNWETVLSSPQLQVLVPPLLAIIYGLWMSSFLGYLSLTRNKKTAITVGSTFSVLVILICLFSSSNSIKNEVWAAILIAIFGSLLAPIVAPELLQDGIIYKNFLSKTKIGSKIGEFTSALLLYRNKPKTIILTAILTAVQHILLIVSLYFFSQSQNLPAIPSFNELFFSSPLAYLAGLIPAPAAGLGVNEAAFETLLSAISNHVVYAGASIFLMQRIWITIFSLIGIPFLIRDKSKVIAT